MERKESIKNEHSFNRISNHPEKHSFSTPIATKGVIVPWEEEVEPNTYSDFKLITSSGLNYFLVTNDDWKKVCNHFVWGTVRLKGMMNIKTMSVVPEEIDADDPDSARAKVIPMSYVKRNLKEDTHKTQPIMTFLPLVS